MSFLKNRLYDAFHEIRAEEELKHNTYYFLQNKVYEKKNTQTRKFTVAAFSVLLFFFLSVPLYHTYFTKTTFIDIDVNPSIELSLNRFDRVIGIYAYNEDGKILLENISIKNKSYQDALMMLINEMVYMDYITDAALFSATLQVDNNRDENELAHSFRDNVDFILQLQDIQVEQEVFVVDADTKTDAYGHNLTPAKYLAILKCQEVDPTATFDNCRDHTIDEIRQQTHEHKGNHRGDKKEEHTHGSGKRHRGF